MCLINIINKYFKIAFKHKSCLNQCSRNTNKERPIKMLVIWWDQKSLNIKSSMCMLNMAIKYNL